MKINFSFFIFILFFSCNNHELVEPKLKLAISNNKIIQRGVIHKIDNQFRFDYYDVYEKDSHMKYLQEKNYQGGGPSWKGIIYGALKLSEPIILNNIRFDDESDGIVIWSKNIEDLIKISRLISTIKTDNKLLLKCISVANKNWKME